MNHKYPWANKDLGQHFLINESVIEQICNNFFNEAEGILEIGPGPGILTEYLSKTTTPYLVVEKDQRFRPYLEKFIKPEQIVMKDALEVNLQDLLEENHFPKNNLWVVSNLPYNISVPLTLKFLSTPSLEKMTLMMQKEVAERIFPEGKKALKSMNSLMALCQTFFSIEKLCPVPPGAFLPPPKVNSTVLSFVRKKAPAFSLSDIPKLEAFFQKLFLQKRKQLGKVLKINFDANKVEKILQEQNIDPQRRSETLTLDEVHELFKKLP